MNAVDITASASTPGVSTSTGRCVEVEAEPVGAGDAADQDEDRDDEREQQLLAVAQQQPRLHRRLGGDLPASGAAPGAGAKVPRHGELAPVS